MKEAPDCRQICPDSQGQENGYKHDIPYPVVCRRAYHLVHQRIDYAGEPYQYDSLSSLEHAHHATFSEAFRSSPGVADHQRSEKNEQKGQGEKRGCASLKVEVAPYPQVYDQFRVPIQN